MLDVPVQRRRAFVPVAVLAVGTFAVGTDAFVVAGFLPQLAASLEVSETAAGQSVTAFAVAYAMLSPILATVTARLSRRALLVGALLVLALANLGSALAPTFAVLLVTRVLAAAGAAAFTPNAGAVAAALSRPEVRGRALATVIGGLTVATAAGVPLGGLAGQVLGWRAALGLVAGACAAVAVAVFAILPALPGQPPVPLRERLSVLRRPAVPAVLALTVLGMAATYTVYAYSAPAMRAVGVESTASMLFLYGVGAIFGNMAAGYTIDRWGASRVLMGGYVVMAASLAGLGWLAGGQDVPVALVGLLAVGWGAGTWCQTPPQQHRLIGVAPQEASLVVSLNASAIYVGIGAGTLIGGLTLAQGVAVTYAAGAVLAVLALLLIVATRRI
ncbi:MFS transporter [Nonomuraea fastidiosa]|jgi:predicted MFS family arabinose efflux permease|uniref:MFS transporter n=1 Tax=Nonomuraea TaxID=83681 RepID=UPI0034133A07